MSNSKCKVGALRMNKAPKFAQKHGNSCKKREYHYSLFLHYDCLIRTLKILTFWTAQVKLEWHNSTENMILILKDQLFWKPAVCVKLFFLFKQVLL